MEQIKHPDNCVCPKNHLCPNRVRPDFQKSINKLADPSYLHPEIRTKTQIFEYWVAFIRLLETRLGGFDWFSTWTFREDTHPESAMKAFRRLTHKINRKRYGVKYWKNKSLGMSSIVAVEYQKRDVIHLHSLDGGTRNFRRLTAMDLWYEMAGIARVYPYRHLNGKGAEGYVAKYIMKGRPWEIRGGGDLFLCGPFTHENDGEWLTRDEIPPGQGTLSPVDIHENFDVVGDRQPTGGKEGI